MSSAVRALQEGLLEDLLLPLGLLLNWGSVSYKPKDRLIIFLLHFLFFERVCVNGGEGQREGEKES